MTYDRSPEEQAWYTVWDRDHAWIAVASMIRIGLSEQQARPLPWLQASRLATLFTEAFLDFREQVEEVAIHNRMRIRQQEIFCPICGLSDCLTAKPVSEMTLAERMSLADVLHKRRQSSW